MLNMIIAPTIDYQKGDKKNQGIEQKECVGYFFTQRPGYITVFSRVIRVGPAWALFLNDDG
jgi:hypothetical protein